MVIWYQPITHMSPLKNSQLFFLPKWQAGRSKDLPQKLGGYQMGTVYWYYWISIW